MSKEIKVLIVASDKNGCFTPFIEEQIDALQKVGISVVRYGITGKGIWGYVRALPGLYGMIRFFRPDLIHAHYGLSCLLANFQRQVPVVSTYHGSDINDSKILIFSRVAVWLSAWNVFVSQQHIDMVQPRKKYSLIPCGINLPEKWEVLQNKKIGELTFNHWINGIQEEGKKHVLFAGAFSNGVKNLELAEKVVAIYNDMHIERPAELIELKGYSRQQVNALMYNSDALLMTSKMEGSPQVIKEAMACGCPVVSVDVGDVAELMKEVEGCYVSEDRDPKKLAVCLANAIDFEGCTKGYERIVERGLTNDLVIKELIAVYNKVL